MLRTTTCWQRCAGFQVLKRKTICTPVPMSKRNETAEERSARKEAVKQQKQERRAVREGNVDELFGQKPCTLCQRPKDLLIRCQIDKTEAWHMVCGKCWKEISGGVVDGDADHPYYRYGGLWKGKMRRQ